MIRIALIRVIVCGRSVCRAVRVALIGMIIQVRVTSLSAAAAFAIATTFASVSAVFRHAASPLMVAGIRRYFSWIL